MTEQKQDRRVKRTKKMIRDALSELMKIKTFEEISVTDITKKADINRGTFYLHYEDKYDLLEQSEEEIIQEINKIAKRSIHSMDILKQDVIDHPLTFVVDIFQYIRENEVFMKAILGPKGPGSFRLKFKSVLSINLKRLKTAIRTNPIVPEDYLISYITGAHISVMQQWLENGMKESPHDMALILSKITGMGPAYAAGLRKK
ncbi:TetR/AcrR family transcriptional regulator C-terminal domain-containing protein [Bacillus haynesii]|uniref:TetR/AcrR family transcriptional regulator C-terminal domain-containing protein n=1 Tax=Bacillus haynesii TaxID=1925021 RepID=UPI001594771E|nr:TetR/AcrR family transcriptional regulator C-terminal domain-containing protein [Bacillus haynesii]NVB32036.1 TetR family transcriptional regulator [Bacillus licheniformis]MCY7780571.1 TetR/AcrR family transcriptional regulator [Bacillus haynesii]MCY7816849.1 TetR/AcrR family transcriptional regulator [Bacillus haynesii]MCY8223845.1 TetR/AcrR family transcriptional regulator [Bacillus haynesii]MCY8243779.1 TetR/AcrR family transcriptional regulator [Bacillus haynesii]